MRDKQEFLIKLTKVDQMLTKLLKQDFGKYASQAYEMALIPEYTSYPAYFDGIKTKEDFLDRASKAFEQENEEILLFFFDGDFSGWIHYFYLEEDRYLDTVSLSASKGMEQMLDEFLRYIAMKYPDATVYLGFPTENRIALGHLTHRGFTVDEISWNTMLELSSAKSGNAPAVSIVPIRKENFGLFEFLHAQRNGQMYWDSGKILCDIDEWVIFAVLRDNRPIGAIYSKRGRQSS